MTPAPPSRVFLGYTSELCTYPADRSFVAAAEAAVIRAGDALLDMAYFTARDATPADYCAAKIAAADVYVGIVGHSYGTPVPGRSRQSYMELEFQAATRLGCPRLVFLLDDRIRPHDLGLDLRQVAVRQRLEQAGVTIAHVISPADLELRLYQALVELPSAGPAAAWLRNRVGAFLRARDELADRLQRRLA